MARDLDRNVALRPCRNQHGVGSVSTREGLGPLYGIILAGIRGCVDANGDGEIHLALVDVKADHAATRGAEELTREEPDEPKAYDGNILSNLNACLANPL
jgi:hypothetical protein